MEKAASGKRRALKEKRMMKRGDSEDEEAQPELPKDEEQKQLVEEKPEPAKIDKMLWRKYLTKGSNHKKKVEIDDDEDDDDDDEDFDEDDEDDEDDESSSEESEEEVKPKKKVESRAKGRKAAPQPAKRRRVRESSSEESEPFQYKVPVKLPDFIKQ